MYRLYTDDHFTTYRYGLGWWSYTSDVDLSCKHTTTRMTCTHTFCVLILVNRGQTRCNRLIINDQERTRSQYHVQTSVLLPFGCSKYYLTVHGPANIPVSIELREDATYLSFECPDSRDLRNPSQEEPPRIMPFDPFNRWLYLTFRDEHPFVGVEGS